jgi:hypothetical protein
MKRILAASASAVVALTGSTFMAAAPASAQPLVTGGLVNVTVTDVIDGDVLSNNNVSLGAALGVAANVCDVNVNVLARQLRSGGATCTSDASGQTVDISQM